MLVTACIRKADSGLQLREITSGWSARRDHQNKLDSHSSGGIAEHLYNAVKAAYRLHVWFCYGANPTPELLIAKPLIEEARAGLLKSGDRAPSDSNDLLAARGEGATPASIKLNALNTLETQCIEKFARANVKERIRILVQLKLIRDKQANLVGFESYIELRRKLDFSTKAFQAPIFLSQLNNRVVSLFSRPRINETGAVAPHSAVFNNALPFQQAFELLSALVSQALGVELYIQDNELDFEQDVLNLCVSKNGDPLGFVLFDARRSGTRLPGNRTLPIANYSSVEGEVQLPIALVSVELGCTDKRMSYAALISIFHEMGHALDHVLDERGGLNSRPVDELEVPSRYFESLLNKSLMSGRFEEIFAVKLSEPFRQAVRGFLHKQYVECLPVDMLLAYFDVGLYESSTRLNMSDVVSLFNKAKFKLGVSNSVSLEHMLARFTVSNIARYQGANHAYLWSHSFVAEDRNMHFGLSSTGGLHRMITHGQERHPVERASQLAQVLHSY